MARETNLVATRRLVERTPTQRISTIGWQFQMDSDPLSDYRTLSRISVGINQLVSQN
jgi:hypothetical protein